MFIFKAHIVRSAISNLSHWASIWMHNRYLCRKNKLDNKFGHY